MQADEPILYAEDSDDDVFLMQRAFIRARVPHSLVTVRDGRAAVDYLGSVATPTAGLRSVRPAPGLILLDLKMPYLTGVEVLKWIRAQPAPIGGLPVLMLSSSGAEQDIAQAFAEGANGYLVKPVRPDELDSLAAGLKTALENVATADWSMLPGARPMTPPGGHGAQTPPPPGGTDPGGAVP